MTSAAAHPAGRRMGQLDAIRAFAILAVFVEHWAGARINDWIPIGAGTLGVGVFFTLSGFLITGTLLSALESHEGRIGTALGQFYIRRFFRLAPAYYVTLLALVLLGIRDIPVSWPWHALYLSNIYVALGGPSNVFWTLAVEEQFYLFWPLLLLLAPAGHRLRAAIGLVAFGVICRVVALLVFSEPQFRLTIFQLELLGAGCILACIAHRPGGGFAFEWLTPRRQRLFTAVALACLVAAVLIWCFFDGKRGGAIRFLLNEPLTGVFYAWIVCMTARGFSGTLGRVLELSVLQYIGRISYGLYLVHSFMPSVLTRLFGELPMAIAAPLTVIGTFGVCALSWIVIEKPLIAVGRRLAARLDAPAKLLPPSGSREAATLARE